MPNWWDVNKKRVPVGIYCCKCKKQYPERKPEEMVFGMSDICECGHYMQDERGLCPTCGVVTEYR